MKLKEYLKELNQLVKDNPKYLDMTVVYCSNEQESIFDEVINFTSHGYYENHTCRFDEMFPPDNAICIN